MATFFESNGVRLVRVDAIQVPFALAFGVYEDLTDKELNEHYDDIVAEYARRGDTPPRSIRGESREWQDDGGELPSE